MLRLLVFLSIMSSAWPLSASVAPATCGIVHTARWSDADFATRDAAVDAVSRAHLSLSRRTDREYVGGILRDASGRFWGTVGAGCPGQDTVTFAIVVPSGSTLAAFWHTHGAPGLFRDLFSPDDAELVRGSGHAFYLVTPDGDLRVLEPDDVAARRHRPPQRSGLPGGALVGRTVNAARNLQRCNASNA